MAAIFPISEISTYTQGWMLCARVTRKSPLRTFKPKNGNEGKVFNADLLDARGGSISCNFFNQAAELFYPKLQQGKCYFFSRGSVRVSRSQFHSTKHRYELTFDKDGLVEEAPEDSQIQTFRLNVTDLATLGTRRTPCKVDLCGVIVEVRPLFAMTSKDGKELARREIVIADYTATSIAVTLWGDRAKEEEKFAGNPVVGFTSILVKEWNSLRSGSLLEEGALVLNPDVEEAQKVRQWVAQGGPQQEIKALSQKASLGRLDEAQRTVTMAEMRKAAEQLDSGCKVFVAICRLHGVQTRRQGEPMPLYYMACQEDKSDTFKCNRRVDASGFCPGCNRCVKAIPRLQLRCHFTDAWDSNWMGTFHEAATEILGMDAEEASALETGEGGRDALEAAVHKRYFDDPLQVMVRVRVDHANGEKKLSVGCFDACPVDRGEHGREMLQEINEMLMA
uniref:Replication protein A 70 kDa DNA-binding subunit n=1 Tax=Lingulaulax polyedra TaxID=160621 RepID=A0A516AG31_LINPO|nr:replication protein A 70 kDa DNA-binding subunit [Lingulodinium polyedra]